MHVDELIEQHPSDTPFDPESLARAIKACFAAAESSSACADACLAEPDVADMQRCIRLDLACADTAAAAGRTLARQGTPAGAARALAAACASLCTMCAEECGQHDHEHCQLCADACRRCADACSELLDG